MLRATAIVLFTLVSAVPLGCSNAAASDDVAAAAEQNLTPAQDAAVRAALATRITPSLAGQDVVVVVPETHAILRIAGDWAWLQGYVELQSGGAPTTNGTDYQLAATVGLFDGWHIEALLKKDASGTWTVLEHGIGDRGVWFWGIWDRYPEADRTLWGILTEPEPQAGR